MKRNHQRFLCSLLVCLLCPSSTTQRTTKLVTLPEVVTAELTVESQPVIIVGEVIPEAESTRQKVIRVQLLGLPPLKAAATPTTNSSGRDRDGDRSSSTGINSSLYKIQPVLPSSQRTYINSQLMRHQPRPLHVVHSKEAWNPSGVHENYPDTKAITRNKITLKKRKQQQQKQEKEREAKMEKEQQKEQQKEKEQEKNQWKEQEKNQWKEQEKNQEEEQDKQQQRQPKKLIFLYNQPTLENRMPQMTVAKTMEVRRAPGAYPVYYTLAKTNGHFGKTPLKSFRRQQDFQKYLVKRKEAREESEGGRGRRN